MVDLTKEESEAKEKNLDDISKILAVVNPDDYYDGEVSEIKKIIQTKGPFIALDSAAGKAEEEHRIEYNSSSETLEPFYFWVLDLMNGIFAGDVKKLVDNFTSTPGSGHFSELQGKATRMQEESMKIMQTMGVLVKSIINIVYDLRDFQILLAQYDELKSTDDNKKKAALLGLKQRWMDNVDIKRGNGSINGMTQQLNFATLRDAFMVADSIESVKKMDLNDRVKRILMPRVQEFLNWINLSEKELRKRYNLERTYLKNQVNSIKMYTRWAKPYLKAASQLEMKSLDDPNLVNAFNTVIFQLTLLGKKAIKVDSEVIAGNIPEKFGRIKTRKYYYCTLVDFYFRGIPSKTGQHYTFGGLSKVNFRGYVLNEDELALFEKMLSESSLNDALNLAEGMTTESLEQLKEDLDYFLAEEQQAEIQRGEKSGDDINPFSALFSFVKRNKGEKTGKNKGEKKEPEFGKIKSDSFAEKSIREIAKHSAKATCFKIFDTYKKAYGMATHADPYNPHD